MPSCSNCHAQDPWTGWQFLFSVSAGTIIICRAIVCLNVHFLGQLYPLVLHHWSFPYSCSVLWHYKFPQAPDILSSCDTSNVHCSSLGTGCCRAQHWGVTPHHRFIVVEHFWALEMRPGLYYQSRSTASHLQAMGSFPSLIHRMQQPAEESTFLL